MKEILEPLTLLEKEARDERCNVLDVWNDNYLTDEYLDDTLGLAIKEVSLKKNGKIDESKDDITFKGIWLTKNQCIILRNHLDSFIQLAETWQELERKEK